MIEYFYSFEMSCLRAIKIITGFQVAVALEDLADEENQ